MANETKKVYLAILNFGNLRREMMTTVIPAMNATPGVELIWENPSKTWANPISSNRCKIVKRFLESDCDYLLMIDDDVVPLHNPCELVHANQDVIGSPALVRAAGQILCWTAYIPHGDGVGYSAVDLDSFDDMFDLLEVSIVGTGCILIKREVLEKIKAPFHSEFDDGIQKYGTDFAFCRRATDAGFKVYTTVHRRCEHFKTIGFNDIDAWDSINYFCRDNAKYGIPWGDFSITQKDWLFIKDKVDTLGCKKILEFGSGLSSLLLSETCEVISYETDPEWKEKIESLITENNNLTIKLWNGNTATEELLTYINIASSVTGKSFDLCFVDGPKSKAKGGIGREVATAIASKISDNVLIHDAGRIEEDGHQRKFLRGVFKLVRKSGNHLIRLHYWKRRPKPVTLEDVKRDLKAKVEIKG
jgi:GT2 family glycosyltransferase